MDYPETESVVHDLGASCERCQGKGVLTEAEADAKPGCPLSPDYLFPVGPAVLAQIAAEKRSAGGRKTRGGQLASARKAAGLTQEAFASKLGISRSLVAMIEAGRATCSDDLLQRARDMLTPGAATP